MRALANFALTMGAAALFAGCGAQGGGTLPPGATAQSKAHKASGSYGDLLYVVLGRILSIYSWPDIKKVKVVNTWPTSLGWPKSNPSNGDICFDNLSYVYVMKHGATQPYATISQPTSSFSQTLDCTFDPTTDNLAITYDSDNGPYYVAIYKPPYDGSPTKYSDPGITYMEWAGYDNNGNLFVDGQDSGGCQCRLWELPKGSSTFIEFQRNYQMFGVGPLLWDGQYMTMTSQSNIYRFEVSGSSITVVDHTAYDDTIKADRFAIQGNTAIGRALHQGTGGARHLGFWHYLRGKQPFNVIKVARSHKEKGAGIAGAAVSIAPSRSRIRK